jgi:hypothetical protein
MIRGLRSQILRTAVGVFANGGAVSVVLIALTTIALIGRMMLHRADA